MTPKLKLGRPPTTKIVKLTIPLSIELKAMLERYADLHAKVTGEQNDLTRLIPFMLESFITNDRAFMNLARAKGN